MTYQRRRGLPATVYLTKTMFDSLGNEHKTVDMDNGVETRVWLMPESSSKAEVPGQQHINVIRVGFRTFDGESPELWSQVEFMGKQWDVAAPPAYHHGTRHTRHWSLDLRERP